MSEPLVCAVMLVNGRHEMVARAVQSFMAQTYPRDRRYLLMWDTGEPHYAPPFVYDPHGIEIWRRKPGPSIGMLRNEAITEARGDVIVTWDSDDWASEHRLTEQVALLQSGDYDAVGYNSMLFWQTVQSSADSSVPQRHGERDIGPQRGESPDNCTGKAYLYEGAPSNYCIGTSLCYWRKTWEARPFPDLPKPGSSVCEDYVFQAHLQRKAVSAMAPDGPRMIASIHGSNTRKDGYDAALRQYASPFRRVPEFDDLCRRTMELEVTA